MLQYFKDARGAIKGNPLRSFLSILWIVIGIMSVVVMLGIGKGAEKKMMDSLGELAKNQIQIYQGWKENTKPVKMTIDTVNYLEKVFPILKNQVSYQTNGGVQLPTKNNYGGYDYMSYYGIPINWFNNNERTILHGAFFTQKHYDNAELVVVINEDVAKYYFPKKENPIGEKITINWKIFAIVGVVKKTIREGDGGDWKNYEARIPYPTFAAKFPNESTINNLSLYLPVNEDNEVWQKRVSYALMKYYGASTISELSVEIDSISKYIDQMKQQQQMMNYLLLAIGSISLLVGGIGVMNIMIVSVTERTKEIWIRKAIGALRSDIILQFLVESVFITLLGGAIAIVLSYVAQFFINKYGEAAQLYSLITPDIIGVAVVVTVLIGIFFGILPAARAAKLQVITALRYE